MYRGRLPVQYGLLRKEAEWAVDLMDGPSRRVAIAVSSLKTARRI
jgi:hypothetical protein